MDSRGRVRLLRLRNRCNEGLVLVVFHPELKNPTRAAMGAWAPLLGSQVSLPANHVAV